MATHSDPRAEEQASTTERFRRILGQLLVHLREGFQLTDIEALLIVDDILLNLEGMAGDWLAEGCDGNPEWCPERIADSLGVLAESLHCRELTEIAAAMSLAAGRGEGSGGVEAAAPLVSFTQHLRRVLPRVEGLRNS